LQIIASSALFLACKVEETPRNLIDVIKVTYTLQFRNNPDKLKLLSNKEVFHSRMDAVLFGERVLLHVLAFDLDIEHPYIYLVQGRKKLPVGFPETEGLKLLQCAWNIVNDSMKISTLSLEHTPRDIGAAAFLLACKWTNLLPRLGSDGGAGFFRQIFRVSMTHIEDLSRAMLELYAGGEEQGKEGVGMMQLQEKGTEEADYRVRGDALGTGGFDQDQKAAIKDPLDLDHLEDGELPA